jgi:hypothetical protein
MIRPTITPSVFFFSFLNSMVKSNT